MSAVRKRFLQFMEDQGKIPKGYACGGMAKGYADGGMVEDEEERDDWDSEWNNKWDTSGSPEQYAMGYAHGGYVKDSEFLDENQEHLGDVDDRLRKKTEDLRSLMNHVSGQDKYYGGKAVPGYSSGGFIDDVEGHDMPEDEVKRAFAHMLMKKQRRGI